MYINKPPKKTEINGKCLHIYKILCSSYSFIWHTFFVFFWHIHLLNNIDMVFVTVKDNLYIILKIINWATCFDPVGSSSGLYNVLKLLVHKQIFCQTGSRVVYICIMRYDY
jgi:hypothetical protein